MNGEQILKILAEYNEKIFPLQYVAYILGFLVLVLACRKSTLSSRIISAIFAMLWLWVAAVFALPYAIDGMKKQLLRLCSFSSRVDFFYTRFRGKNYILEHTRKPLQLLAYFSSWEQWLAISSSGKLWATPIPGIFHLALHLVH